jgi:hypothetical protein
MLARLTTDSWTIRDFGTAAFGRSRLRASDKLQQLGGVPIVLSDGRLRTVRVAQHFGARSRQQLGVAFTPFGQ